MSVPRAKRAFRFSIAVTSVAVSILLAEVALRCFAPTRVMLPGVEIPHWRQGSEFFARFFEPDPELGYCPILDTEAYDEHGILRNGYSIEKRPGVVRLLFVGDSVTARGHVVDGLRRRYGGERFEYWNAGVESFNTVQEVEWYLRHNHRIRPDHVVVTLHPNDFSGSLVALNDEDGRIAMYSTTTRVVDLDPWLFRNSEIYRRIFLARLANRSESSWDEAVSEVREAVRRLRDRLTGDGIRLSVLVLPTMLPRDEWPDAARLAHQAALDILDELDVRRFDLLPALERAIASGVAIQEEEGDTWHPSVAASDVFAAWLEEQSFLQ